MVSREGVGALLASRGALLAGARGSAGASDWLCPDELRTGQAPCFTDFAAAAVATAVASAATQAALAAAAAAAAFEREVTNAAAAVKWEASTTARDLALNTDAKAVEVAQAARGPSRF